MKVRSGFVSNSSSSSFIVEHHNTHPIEAFGETGEPKITEEQTRKLLKYGFQWTWKRIEHILLSDFLDKSRNISCVGKRISIWGTTENGIGKIGTKRATEKDCPYLGYFVLCNEDDVMRFLVKNKISFGALTNYGNIGIIYNSEKDLMISAMNYGLEMLACGYDLSKETIWGTKKCTKGTGKDYLKGKYYP